MTAYRPTAARTALAREIDSEISGDISRGLNHNLDRDLNRDLDRDIDRDFAEFRRGLGRDVRPGLAQDARPNLDRNADRAVERHSDRPLERHVERPLERRADRPVEPHADRPADRPVERHTETPAGRDVNRRGRTQAADRENDYENGDEGDAGFGAGDERRRPAFAPSSLIRGRAMFAAVTFGALTAAAAGQSLLPKVAHEDAPPLGRMQDVSVVFSTVSDNQDSLVVAPPARQVDASAEVAQLVASQQAMSQQGNTADQTAVGYVKPTDGTVVSTFGGQYGTFHYGIEIAGSKDQPIVAVTAGKIIAAGPASGFGLWVKEELPDGTILVYARVADYSVHIGQAVTAGEQIAGMGDGGFSTGYTLHFEVWDPDNKKVDPESWLNSHGVIV